LDPKGKVALITGAARIGQAVAQTLAARGCALALAYRSSRAAADAAAASAREAGVRAVSIQADATDEAQIRAAVQATVQDLGRLDILINMASTYIRTPEPSSADWTAAVDANARSAFLFSIHAAPIMRAVGGGRIVNMSDWLVISGRPRYKGYTPYFASKAAVTALTQSMALDLAPDILVNSIAPGPILAPPDLSEAELAEVMAATPLARWGGAEEIAKAALFLIETDFITGESIRVDGGRHLA
jgi:NAD(P)-dependent dehydrogenase (short-subunit alcohol dehydrogenase family)